MAESTRICASYYTVKTGDSYFSIARQLNVPLDDLLAANPQTPPSKLMVGDRLCVPCTDVNTPAQGGHTSSQPAEKPDATPDPLPPADNCPANRRTVVQMDQTAEELQLKYGLSLYTLQNANPTTDLGTLQAGDILCIPEENVPCPVPNTYTIETGGTLESAAMALQVPVGALLRANPCMAPNDFEGGVTIRVPRTR